MTSLTSEELMALHQTGNADAFNALYARHQAGVKGASFAC